MKRSAFYFSLISSLVFCFNALAQQNPEKPEQGHAPYAACHYHERAAEPREHELDIQRVRLDVRFEPENGKVLGRVTHIFKTIRRQVDSVFFDGPGIVVESAKLGGAPLRFKMLPNGIVVYPSRPLKWDEQDSIEFVYTATPRKGVYFIGWNDPKDLSRKQIWTQGQAEDHRYWIPCYDNANDKVISETRITFDGGYQVLSNGLKISETPNADGSKTWHYRMTHPHSLYLLMLAIGKYEVKSFTSQSGVPINLWYYPDWADRFETTYRYSVEAVNFMEAHTGIPYPWGTYAQVPVQDFIYGAMENTSATIFGDFFCVDAKGFHDRNYVNVNVHELTHQWFGDLITHRSGSHIWLHESFATFYPKLFERQVYGQDMYQWRRRTEHNTALDAAKGNDYPIVGTKGGTPRIYPKGSAVLDMMLYAFGEDAYRRVINKYLRQNAYNVVETNDLYQAYQDVLGVSPAWFFDQWLYGGGEPHYQVSYRDLTENGRRKTDVTVKQIHPRYNYVNLFKMPVVFEVNYTDGSRDSIRAMIDQETQTVSVPNVSGKTIAFVLFDPGSYILKKITFNKSFDELRAQALGARNMIDRFDAVAAMRNLPIEQKRATLVEVFNREKFHYVLSEIVAQLTGDAHADSKNVIRKAIDNPQAEVRMAVISEVKTIPADLLDDYEQLLIDSSYNVQAEALDKLYRLFPENADAYLEATKKDYGIGAKVRVKWLEVSVDHGQNPRAVNQLVDMASVSYEFRTRQNAIEALQRLNYLDPKLLTSLIDATLNPNTRLAAVAQTALKYYLGQIDYRRDITKYIYSRNWEKWQNDILQPLLK